MTTEPSTAALAKGLAAANRALDIEAAALKALPAQVEQALPAAISLLAQARGRIVVSGLGKSGHIGAKIAASLASMGSPAFFIHSTEALHGDSGMVAPGDVAVLISNSGRTAEVVQFGRMISALGVPVIAMASDATSPLAQLAQVFLSIAVEQEADPLGLAPTASTAVTLAIGDALAAGLMAMRDFSPADFAQRHPGGALGAQLSGDELPGRAGLSGDELVALADFDGKEQP